MLLAPVDIHFCISFNIIAITKFVTNESHLWSGVCCYQFPALCDQRSLQSNQICKFGKFHCVFAICCNLDAQITPSTGDFQASTN